MLGPGYSFQEIALDLIKNAEAYMRYSGTIEFTILTHSSDEVTAEMPVTPGVMNPYGTVHAGATLWFADVTATTLVLEGKDASKGMKGFPLAINLNANLTGNQSEGVFLATAST